MTAQTTTKPGGHLPTLIASFLHFDLSFMLWVLVGALGIFIADDLKLSPSEKGWLVAFPVLTGSLLRIPVGILSDRLGGKRIGTALLAMLYLPLFLGWQFGDSLGTMSAIGLLLGCAGASFAVALPLASRWYPPERQGLVMGIAAAGNSGTVLANLFAPRIALAVGWHNVFGLAMLPLTLVLLAFVLMAKDYPRSGVAPSLKAHLAVLRHPDMWWFCAFYSVTFGGYVGLSSFLPIFMRDQYHVSPTDAGLVTAAGAFVGSGLRPLGGYLADRFGGVRMLSVLLVAIGTCYAVWSRNPDLLVMVPMLLVGMGSLGMGNGAVFQMVPQRFRADIGLATGMVGAVGGLGGFLLPVVLGSARQSLGSFEAGFLALAGFAVVALVLLRVLTALHAGWRFVWRPGPSEEAAA